MGINAGSIKPGMSLSFSDVYVYVEAVAREAAGMVAVTVRDYAGRMVPVRFHEAEFLTVGA